MRYFDYDTVARQAGIPADKLARLVKSHAEEEPNDPMLAALHAMRACTAIKDGRLTVEEALAESLEIAARELSPSSAIKNVGQSLNGDCISVI